MDAFFASVEQLDNPKLRGKPVAVGGSMNRGVVAAASYEARKFGVRSAMPSITAVKKCPHLIFVKPRFERYKEISDKIRAVFYKYSDLVEPLSLDEAYLDVSTNKINHSSATIIAQLIREEIKETTGLNASAGISINKFVAKIASDINKPNGQKTILPEEIIPFLDKLSIHKFYGIGAVTAEKMKKMGVFKGYDLRQYSLKYLVETFGRSGEHYFNIARGIDSSNVISNRIRKSIAVERTFSQDVYLETDLKTKLSELSGELEKRLLRHNKKGKTISLKVKYNDFTQQTRSKTLDDYVQEKNDFYPIVTQLLEQHDLNLPVRLIGLSLSNLEPKEILKRIYYQLKLPF